MKAQRICTTFLLLNLVLMVNGDDDKDSVDTTGYCSVYNGKICKAHISSRQVWFSSADGSGGWLNEQTTVNLFEEMISELPEICRAAAEVNTPIYLYDHSNLLITVLFQKLLCAFAFPHCLLNNEGLTLKLPLCYEGESMRKRWMNSIVLIPIPLPDCVATHLQFCYNDWVLIEEKKLKGQVFKSRGTFRLPNCTALPRYIPKRRTCSYVGLTELDESKVTRELISPLISIPPI